MCGIAGAIHLRGEPVPDLGQRLAVMSQLIEHRGPDDADIWMHERGHVGLAHRRLSIIDIASGHQPMGDEAGRWITYNGEVYNYPELRVELGSGAFRTSCDTEVVLRAHGRWGVEGLTRLRGMFAYAIWDEQADELVCARDRFGIKPFYYAVVDEVLYFASEAKALLPFVPAIETDVEGLKDYLVFQFCLDGKTLFKGVRELPGGQFLRVRRGRVEPERYWEVYYDVDYEHTSKYFEERVEALLSDSVRLHLRSDVPVAAYLSGGLDSSVVAALAGVHGEGPMKSFTGRFPEDERYDESGYARAVADARGLDLHLVDIGVDDFLEHMESVVYHLDYPTAGPGSFPQYMVSREASRHGKVIVGGQGGDEIFGGYTRYLIAYFEQCIKAAIEGTMHKGNFVVTYESIIPNLVALRNYRPLLQEFWRDGLFEELDARYFRLIDRAPTLGRRDRLERARAVLAVRDLPGDLQRRQRGPPVLLRQDDSLRLQDPAAGAAAGRGQGQHGPRPRIPCAAARPRARRARGHGPVGRQVQGRDDEAPLQARDALARSRHRRAAHRQDGLSGPADRMARGSGERVRRRRLLQSGRTRARSHRQCQGAGRAAGRAALRPQGLGAAVARAVAARVPRPRAALQGTPERER